MAGFRVADHAAWRDVQQPATTETPPAARPPDPPAGDPVRRLERQVEQLGAIALPARAFDGIFGWAHRRHTALFAVTVLLLLAATALIAGGVSGTGVVDYDVGTWSPSGSESGVAAFLAPGSTYRYSVNVARGNSPGPTSLFGIDHGEVRVPTFDSQGPAYGLKLRVVRLDPSVQPHLLVAEPGRSMSAVRPTSDDGVVMTFEPGRFTESGAYSIVLTSNQGRGDVELRMQVVKAPVERDVGNAIAWVPIIAGAAIVVVAAGAFSPGARLLRERRRLLARENDRVYARLSRPEPNSEQTGFARIRPFKTGVMAWEKPGTEVPERLAQLPGNGWVIRLD